MSYKTEISLGNSLNYTFGKFKEKILLNLLDFHKVQENLQFYREADPNTILMKCRYVLYLNYVCEMRESIK